MSFRRNPRLRRSDGEEAPFAGHARELVTSTDAGQIPLPGAPIHPRMRGVERG
jgi:hypothetical protein